MDKYLTIFIFMLFITVLFLCILRSKQKCMLIQGGNTSIKEFNGRIRSLIKTESIVTKMGDNVLKILSIDVSEVSMPIIIKQTENKDSKKISGKPLRWLGGERIFQLSKYVPKKHLQKINVGYPPPPFYNGTCTGICNAIFEGSYGCSFYKQRNKMTSCWTSTSKNIFSNTPDIDKYGRAPPFDSKSGDIYFLCVPNVHITTCIYLDPLDYILEKTAMGKMIDTNWTLCVMKYVKEMVNAAKEFACKIQKLKKLKKVRVVWPTDNKGRNYKLFPPNSGYSNLYMSFHCRINTENHLHLHCWLNGEDDGFEHTKKHQLKYFNQLSKHKVEYDLGQSSVSGAPSNTLPVECFFKMIGSGSPIIPKEHIKF